MTTNSNRNAFKLNSSLSSFLILLLAFASSAFADGNYHIIKKVPIPGQGGWDYLIVDGAARRLYVSHATQVEVLDVDSGTILGKIPDTLGVHGIAIAPESGRGFVSDGQTSTVTIFDLKTMKSIGEVPTGKKPDAIIYDPATSQVFAFNGGSDSTTAISAADGKVAGTVDLGGGPEFAVADGNGYVFNNLEDKSQVVKINSRKLVVEQHWPLAPCESPYQYGDGPSQPASFYRLPEQADGGGRCGLGKSHHDGSDWRACGRHCFRS